MTAEDESGRYEYPCRRAKPEDLPDWFSELLDKNLSKMAEIEGKKEL